MAFLVRDLPDTHPRKNEVNLLAKNFFEAILKYQNERGTWHQEMTDPTSYVETSGSGLMLFAIGIAIEKGVLDKSYLAQFKKGLSGYLTYIGEDGSVSYTCAGCLCPGKGTKKEYMKKSWVFNDPHAFGPVVLAFTQAAKMGIKEITPLPTISGQAPKMGSLAFNHDVPRKPQTYVRYMPEGNGNILWENDRIAYRVYGPPAKHRVSSGIDIWTKSVSYPIIDKWYKLNHEGKEYHIERGEGNDFYHVSTGRGTGGTAIWHKGKPYISQTYATYKILKHTETEIAFELKYDPWDVDGMKVWEKKVISMKMGTNLFKVETTFETDTKQPLTVAIGISYDKKPIVVTEKKQGLLTLWESYTAQNNGELGMAVCVKPSTIQDFTTYEKEHYVLLNAKSGKKITYYAGAGWTKNPDFKTQQDWIDYLNKELPTLKF